jgi:molybdopterin-guanine dinucleotide biosynthesis protein A
MTDSFLTGVILAGGASSRFGGVPKGLEMIGGSRIIDRVASALRPVTFTTMIVSNDPRADAWLPGSRVVRDRFPLRASIVGVHAALVESAGDALVVAWDMPFVPSALLWHLASLRGSDTHAIVPRIGGRPEPCCAVYSRAMIPLIERHIEAGTLAMSAVFETTDAVRYVDEDTLELFGSPRRMFANVNTPDDLRALASEGDATL